MGQSSSTRTYATVRSLPGFTLVELLVVVSIVGVLMSLMLPSMSKVREDARRTVCVANLKSVGTGLFAYSADHGGKAPPIMAPLGTTAPRTLLSRTGQAVNLGLLQPLAIQDPRIFFCPSQKKFNFRPIIEELQTHTVGGSYAYAVQIPALESPRASGIRHLAMASDDFVARLGDVGIGKYSHRTGYNVLYTDGSATWYSDADESIWKQSVHWDNEKDDINYDTLYDTNGGANDGLYGDALDIFRVWWAFCYSQPDRF